MSDALTYIGAQPYTYKDSLHIMLLEMYRRRTTFWAWTLADWQEIMCENPLLFAQRFGRSSSRTLARRHLPVLAYLLKVQPNIKRLIEIGEQIPLAHDIFGKEAVDRALEPPFAVLQGWGYSLKEYWNPAACLAYLLMYNESPYLEHLSFELLVEVSQTCQLPCVQQSLYRISRALCALSIIEQPLPDARVVPPQWRGMTTDLAPEWLAAVSRWRERTTLQNSEHEYYQLLKVGRWLKAHHPEVRSPADLTQEIDAKTGEPVQFLFSYRGKRI
jgi:hypothetical protein